MDNDYSTQPTPSTGTTFPTTTAPSDHPYGSTPATGVEVGAMIGLAFALIVFGLLLCAARLVFHARNVR